ncbi:MAG: hypothetical protein AAGA75_01990, partial [Cyanobacteria bacterium P01_E01_bin.6]
FYFIGVTSRLPIHVRNPNVPIENLSLPQVRDVRSTSILKAIALIPIMESQGRSPVYRNRSLNLGLDKREISLRQRSGIKRTTEDS